MPHVETTDVSEERVALGHGVEVPMRWSVIVSDEPGVPGIIRVDVVHDALLNRAVAAEVRVSRQREGDEVTSLTLREVRVQHALQVSGLLVSTVSEPGHAVVSGAGYIQRMQKREGRDPRRNRRGRVQDVSPRVRDQPAPAEGSRRRPRSEPEHRHPTDESRSGRGSGAGSEPLGPRGHRSGRWADRAERTGTGKVAAHAAAIE